MTENRGRDKNKLVANLRANTGNIKITKDLNEKLGKLSIGIPPRIDSSFLPQNVRSRFSIF